jgi:hypothetical protein
MVGFAAAGGYADIRRGGHEAVAESEMTPLSESIKQVAMSEAETEDFGDV